MTFFLGIHLARGFRPCFRLPIKSAKKKKKKRKIFYGKVRRRTNSWFNPSFKVRSIIKLFKKKKKTLALPIGKWIFQTKKKKFAQWKLFFSFLIFFFLSFFFLPLNFNEAVKQCFESRKKKKKIFFFCSVAYELIWSFFA